MRPAPPPWERAITPLCKHSAIFAISQHFWTGVKLLTKWHPHDCERTYLYMPFPTVLYKVVSDGRTTLMTS